MTPEERQAHRRQPGESYEDWLQRWLDRRAERNVRWALEAQMEALRHRLTRLVPKEMLKQERQ